MFLVRAACRLDALLHVLGDGALSFSFRHPSSTSRSSLLMRTLSCVSVYEIWQGLADLRICRDFVGHEAWHRYEDAVAPLHKILMPGVMKGRTS